MREEDNMSDGGHHEGRAAAGFGGAIWFIGWLFFIGYLSPVWWKIIVGIILWPYYLGVALR